MTVAGGISRDVCTTSNVTFVISVSYVVVRVCAIAIVFTNGDERALDIGAAKALLFRHGTEGRSHNGKSSKDGGVKLHPGLNLILLAAFEV